MEVVVGHYHRLLLKGVYVEKGDLGHLNYKCLVIIHARASYIDISPISLVDLLPSI